MVSRQTYTLRSSYVHPSSVDIVESKGESFWFYNHPGYKNHLKFLTIRMAESTRETIGTDFDGCRSTDGSRSTIEKLFASRNTIQSEPFWCNLPRVVIPWTRSHHQQQSGLARMTRGTRSEKKSCVRSDEHGLCSTNVLSDHPEYQDDDEVVEAAVRNDPKALHYGPSEMVCPANRLGP